METLIETRRRVMLDANVIVAGVVWPRWPYEVLEHAVKGDYQLVISPRIIYETRKHRFLQEPESLTRLEQVLTASTYELVDDPAPEEATLEGHLMRDFTDIPIALAAINAKVDCFVTHDKDFTERNESTEELHRRLNIMLPAVFLRDYMGWTSEALEAIRHRNWDE